MRIRNPFVGVDAHIDPHGARPFLRNIAATPPLPHGRTEASAPTECLRIRRWCVQICDCNLPGRCGHRPLRVVRVCRCILRGRGRTPPLRQINTSSLFTITSYLSCPAPTLRRNAGQLRTYSPSPHPSACGCHLPHTGKALGIANPPEISNLFCEGLQILS